VIDNRRINLIHDLVLPTLLFAALGGMTWAVRGCSGFGAVWGCVFAGVTWGAAWWYIARDPSREQSRRYASGWIVLAVTLGVGLSGERGWMQWSSFFDGHIQTIENGGFLPISRSYGFLWMFIAGVPWAGLGACLLAWCGSLAETRIWHWVVRIGCGAGVAALGRWLIDTYPQIFLPLYQSLESRYQDVSANPNLGKLINDCRDAFSHLGYFLGFLLFELIRRDWKNSLLILTVGLINGAGWALCQCWSWAPGVWGNANFNFWRCWESSGGISIGIAYGIAYFLVNRRMSDREQAVVASRRALEGPNFEWLLVFFGLTSYLYTFLAFRLHGWAEIYFSTLFALGAAYYLVHRASGAGLVVLLTILFVAGLLARTIAGVFPQSIAAQLPTSRRGWLLIWEVYSGVVLAFGLFWYVLWSSSIEKEKQSNTPTDGDPSLERLGLALGLLIGLGISVTQGLKGWFNIYKGNENYWDRMQWQYFGWIFLALLLAIGAKLLLRSLPRDFRGNPFRHAYGLMWLVLIVQNAIAQLITGPLTSWPEVAFSIYYALLFAITAVIVIHFHSLKTTQEINSIVAGYSSAGRSLGEA
jgi:hypothetical protein